MSVLVVGATHRSTPMELLERVVLDPAAADRLRAAVAAAPHVTGAVVVSTCNRLEVYAEVDGYHAALDEVSALLAEHTGVDAEVLGPHLAVHHGERAVGHLFAVVCGLDSMVVGEAQVLGQVRAALRAAEAVGTAGRELHELLQRALRVGKRAHAETGIDRAGPSVVASAVDVAAARAGGLAGRRAVVVGAGSTGALAVARLRAAGVSDVVVLNRTPERARRLAASAGVRAGALDDLADALVDADVLVSCTGAVGTVVPARAVAAARDRRTAPGELVCLDLALPHDVDPAVGALPGVTLVGLSDLAALARTDADAARDVAAVRAIVAEEVAAHLAERRAQRAAPTVVALRERAARLVEDELARLDARRPDLDPDVRADVEQALRRVVSALLHRPTVRLKELAAAADDAAFAELVERLTSEDLGLAEAVAAVLPEPGGAS